MKTFQAGQDPVEEWNGETRGWVFDLLENPEYRKQLETLATLELTRRTGCEPCLRALVINEWSYEALYHLSWCDSCRQASFALGMDESAKPAAGSPHRRRALWLALAAAAVIAVPLLGGPLLRDDDGQVARGGDAQQVGTGGTPDSGGTNSGGTTSSGGASTTGGATTSAGGTTNSGGASTTGGAANSGGTTNSGGASTTGGAANSGGTTNSGGASTTGGATTSAGGTTNSGGASTTGGAATSGGTTTPGGAASTVPHIDPVPRAKPTGSAGQGSTTGGSGHSALPETT